MTGAQIWALALGYLSETAADNTEMEPFALQWINTRAAECLGAENSVRKWQDDDARPVLTSAPVLETLADELPYCDGLCRIAIPYGVAAMLWTDDDNDYRANKWETMYREAVYNATVAEVDKIIDVYGGDGY